MHRIVIAFLACIALAVTGLRATPAQAAQPAKRFANCAALTKIYPSGVAKSSRAANRAVRGGMERPKVNSKVYWQNSRSDRDKDGVACEQSA